MVDFILNGARMGMFMNKKKQIQVNIIPNKGFKQEVLNRDYANYFETIVAQQFCDKCHFLEAQRLLKVNQPILEMKTIINDENICNTNIRAKMWQNPLRELQI